MKIGKYQPKTSKARIVGVILSALVIAGAGFVYYGLNNKTQIVSNVTEAPTPKQESTVPTLAPVSETPSGLIIDKLGINAPIVPVGLTTAGAMDAPGTNEEVGWYNKSALAGHSDFAVLLDGHFGTDTKPGVFYRLSELSTGDAIVIRGDKGTLLTYKVVEMETLALEDVDMQKALYPYRQGSQSLTIITCEGTYDKGRATYDKRSLVYAERVL